jgi:uncharacterized protein (DUF2147 family)
MKRIFALAALLLASSAAHAGDSYSFEIGGRTIHIDAPTGCDQPSCLSISIPGVYNSAPQRGRRTPVRPDPDTQARTDPQQPAIARPEQPAANPPTLPQTTTGTVAKAPTDPVIQPPSLATEKPVEPTVRTEEPPVRTEVPSPPVDRPVVATAPVTAPVQREPAPIVASRTETSPLGIWQTEKKEGLVRIEACGNNLCGYSVNAKTNQNGEQVLINMKPSGEKWTGRIHDPKSGGNYDSTIAMRGTDSLRVQGCAFGGMFCGGQTWTRVN